MRNLKTISFIFIFIWAAGLSAQTDLSSKLDNLLSSEDFLKTSEVGISVFDLTSGSSLYRYQDEKLYRPASIEKLITTITGLARLGTSYTFDTRLGYTGILDEGQIDGDLYVIGGFDPEFDEKGMDYLVTALADYGIKRITGKIYGDISLTDSLYWGNGWSWDDNPAGFQPYLSPLMYHKGCVEITARPTCKGALAQIDITPVSTYYTLDNQTRSFTPEAGKYSATRNWLENGNFIRLSGNVHAPCTKQINLYDSQNFFMHAFLEKLHSSGIKVTDTSYSFKEFPTDSFTLLATYSHTLTAAIKEALKKSDNLSAEAIFYQLGANYSGQKHIGSKEGSKAIYSFIEQLAYHPKSYKIADGSGVSLYNYVSPELILAFLKYAWEHPILYENIREALPIAGEDGTLEHRMKKGKAYKNVRAKTGTVTGISSLAGYAYPANGHTIAFVIINQNVLDPHKARNFQDKVCEILCM